MYQREDTSSCGGQEGGTNHHKQERTFPPNMTHYPDQYKKIQLPKNQGSVLVQLSLPRRAGAGGPHESEVSLRQTHDNSSTRLNCQGATYSRTLGRWCSGPVPEHCHVTSGDFRHHGGRVSPHTTAWAVQNRGKLAAF